LFSPLEDKSHILAPPCNIFYISLFFIYLYTFKTTVLTCNKCINLNSKSTGENLALLQPLYIILNRTLHGGLNIWLLSSGKILFSPLEDKSHILAPPCNIFYISLFFIYLYTFKTTVLTCNKCINLNSKSTGENLALLQPLFKDPYPNISLWNL
jgi:hypothetical protein